MRRATIIPAGVRATLLTIQHRAHLRRHKILQFAKLSDRLNERSLY